MGKSVFSFNSLKPGLFAEESKKEACGNSGTYDSSDIRSHGVHQQEVAGIGLLTLNLGYPRRHGYRGYALRSRLRIYLAAGYEIHNLAEKNAADSAEAEGDKTEDNNFNCRPLQEGTGIGGCSHGDAQEYSYNVY